MKKLAFFPLLIGLIVLIFSTSFAQQKTSPTKEEEKIVGKRVSHQIVRIEAYIRDPQLLGVDPKIVYASKGTTVIWLNDTSRHVAISFAGGDKVRLSCEAPVNFILGEDGTYKADKIPMGGTASLCFIESGTFKYKVTPSPPARGIEPLEGNIIVE